MNAEFDREEWQTEQYVNIFGMPYDEALFLVGQGIDYHDYEKLLESGCDRETARKILV